MGKRDKKADIRWSQYELDMIHEARGETTLSDFVRDAAITKAIEINDYVKVPKSWPICWYRRVKE